MFLEGPTHINVITCEEVNEANVEEMTRENVEPEITLHALTGWSAPKSMCVDAKVGLFEVVVLIDSGSNHNFMSTYMVDLLQLLIVPTEAFTVRVTNATRLQCQGKFKKYGFFFTEFPSHLHFTRFS